MVVILTDVVRHVRSLGIRWRYYLHAQGVLIVLLASLFIFIPGRKYLSMLRNQHFFSILTWSSLRAICVSR